MKKKLAIVFSVVIVLVLVGWIVFGRKAPQIQSFTTVREGDIVQTVSVTGNVKPAQNVDLAFEKPGKVQRVYVDVGNSVRTGQVLVELDSSELSAQLAKAEADLDAQKADLNKSNIMLANDYDGISDTLNDAYTKANDAVRNQADALFLNPETNPKLAFSTTNSQIQIDIESERQVVGNLLNSWQTELAAIGSDASHETLEKELANGESRLTAVLHLLDLATNAVNSSAPLATSTVAAYKAQITTARTEINTALSNINTKGQDIRTQQAVIESEITGIKSYAANVDDINAQIKKTTLFSPIDGVVTKADAKVGELAVSGVVAVSIISNSQFDIEANVPEADIAKLAIGDTAKLTLDAYGNDVTFDATVTKIDPGEVVIDGVPTYKVTFKFSKNDPRIRSGMTANLDVLAAKKEKVLIAPQRSVVLRDNGEKYVLFKTADGKTEDRTVMTGLRGSDGNIEIISGLKEGDQVATFGE